MDIGAQNMISGSINTAGHQQAPSSGARVTVLPLNLLALIVSYLDNTADLARVCQTCRVLYYMTLPQLYNDITLRSYDTIRYRGQRPEGCGSASPFSMGLNALVTRNIASLVRSLTLRGEWKEHDIEEYGRVGRVPDNSMMLNIAVRAAIDQTTALESFNWDLNTKMLLPIYGGLASRQKLRSLTIRFPTTKTPRPTITIPAFPHLEALKLSHIDPLCHPDDFSHTLRYSSKLRSLKLHFSPRMRAENEPSTNLFYYFRKIASDPNYKLSLRELAMQNLFTIPNEDDFGDIFDEEKLEVVTVLNCTGDDEDINYPITFADMADHKHKRPKGIMRLKSTRFDRLARSNVDFLGNMYGLEKMYFVSAPPEQYPPPTTSPHSMAITNGVASSLSTPISPSTPSTTSAPQKKNTLRDDFLSLLFANHGPTLRHILLPTRWLLSPDLIAQLVRSCPNLTQLGLAVERANLDSLRLLLSFLPKLHAFRILRSSDGSDFTIGSRDSSNDSSSNMTSNPGLTPSMAAVLANGSKSCPPDDLQKPKPQEKQKEYLGAAGIEFERDELHISMMSRFLAQGDGFPLLRYIGLGQKVFEVGGIELVDEEIEPDDVDEAAESQTHNNIFGKGSEVSTPPPKVQKQFAKVRRRRVRRVPWERAMAVEIWGLDKQEI